MSSIDPTNRLAALMSAQVAAMRDRAAARQADTAPKDASVRGKPDQGQDPASLAVLRMQAIKPDDPQRQRKAFRIFLETVLLAELGSELAADPAFSGMVDDVHRQMEEDADLAPALAEAAQHLLSRQKAGR